MVGRVVEIETNDRHLAIKRGFLVVSEQPPALRQRSRMILAVW